MNTAENKVSEQTRKYDEAAIKALVLTELLRDGQLDKSSRIASEFAVGIERRADLALFNGAQFVGIEVKSDFDSLKRLDGQLTAYSKVFDRLIVVVTERHMTRAFDDRYGHADLWCVTPYGVVQRIRTANRPQQTCKQALAALLSKEELVKIVGAKGQRVTRAVLSAAVEDLDTTTIRASVIQSFSERFEVTSRRFFKSVARSDVKPRHLERLSRFANQRKIIQAHKRESDEFWKAWAKAAEDAFSTSTAP